MMEHSQAEGETIPESSSVYDRAQLDRMLGVTSELVEELRRLVADGMPTEELIWFLYRQGVTKPGAKSALHRAGVMSLGKAKLAVHDSRAYEFRRAADEAFHESALTALDVIEKQERANAAA